MREMVARAVIPDLVARSGVTATIHSRVLRAWGMAESTLAEVLGPRLTALDEAASAGLAAPTIAFLASGIEGIKVRITVKAATVPEAEQLIATEEKAVRDLLGPVVFGVDEETMEAAVGGLLRAQGRTLATAESLTGGLVGARITAVPGASEWFRGSIVAYATEVKQKLLGIAPGPAVSEAAAREMAEGAVAALGADVGLSLTGVAGPDQQDGQPVGTVWVGLCAGGHTETRLFQMPSGEREQIRQIATISALDLLRRHLLETG
jgi:nicotinamide-nucleotide amidase